jgi:hypothetical protein
MSLRRLLAAAYLGFELSHSGAAVAQTEQLSELEQDTLETVLADRGAQIDPEPEGKVIEQIEIVTLDVFDEKDPVPDFMNVFHTRSLPGVIRRELLFRVGQPYDPEVIDESARNLRSAWQLTLVLIVPLRETQPDRVRVLVITRDVWSLRINAYFEAALSLKPLDLQLNALLLQPSEINLAGTHTRASVLFTVTPDTYSAGAAFAVPRVDGTRVRAAVGGNVIFNRHSGHPEGTYGHLLYGQPLYSVYSRWGWGLLLSWRSDIARSYVGTELRTVDADITPFDDRIPLRYDRDEWFGEYELVRSYGHRFKHDVSLGVEASRDVYVARPPAGVTRAAFDEFVDEEVPVSDQRLSPFVQLRTHDTGFLRALNVDTLGLQEDYRLGPDVIVRLYPASRGLGSTRSLLGLLTAGSYTARLGDGLARGIAASTAELADQDQSDVLFEGNLHLVTPRFGFGRLVYDARAGYRYRDYLIRRFQLGGDNRLRGYAAGEFRGKDLLVSNLEYRSSSMDILSAQVGGVLFYDVGDACNGFEQMEIRQSVGLGARVLFPQSDRVVLRIDWGFPISADREAFPGAVFLTWGQAVPLRGLRRSGAADPSPSLSRGSAISSEAWPGETL